jgi:hypothetical protein
VVEDEYAPTRIISRLPDGADITLRFGVIKKPADPGAYTHEIWEMAQKK